MSKIHEEKKRNNHRIYMSTMRKIRKTSSVIISNQHILQDKPINNNLQSQMQSNEQIHYLNEDREILIIYNLQVMIVHPIIMNQNPNLSY